MVTRGFGGRRPPPDAARRLPPGQHLVEDFPVLSAGPTPRVPTESWTFTVKVGPRAVRSWTWSEFLTLPQTELTPRYPLRDHLVQVRHSMERRPD